MQLVNIAIQNYKSLRHVSFAPGDFSVLIGRNSSGKSNFADAFEFLSLAYADGLEHAVARKGGYENIAHRKERRSRSAISFSIELADEFKLAQYSNPFGSSPGDKDMSWVFRHSFEFRATGEGIRSDFRIISEHLEVIGSGEFQDGSRYQWVRIERSESGKIAVKGDLDSAVAQAMLIDSKFWSSDLGGEFNIPPSELLFVMPFFRSRVIGRFTSWMRNIGIFQISPEISRHSGVPTPNPHLSARGENLPAVVDWLQRKKPKEWRLVMQAMRNIVPEISEISVSYLHTRTLGLFFSEKGIGRAWTAEEVSDGTIRALSMLVACFDPRNTAIVVEEPENSLHPWIIKEIIDHLKSLSRDKLVMVTSHSPTVLNMISPRDVWVIFKHGGETSIRPLVDFDEALMEDWSEGKYRLFDYLESGYVSEAVPSPL